MKKSITILISLMLVFTSLFAQNTESDYVIKKEFQDKTKSLGYQVSSIKTINSNLSSELNLVKETIENLDKEIKKVQKTDADATVASKAKDIAINNSLEKHVLYFNIFLYSGIFYLLLTCILIIFIKRFICKRFFTIQQQLTETNNKFYEQGVDFSKEIFVLKEEIFEMKQEIESFKNRK